MIFRLELALQLLAANRIWSRRDRRRARLIPGSPIALQTSLVQALLVAANVVVALRIEVRPKPVHLSDSPIAGNPWKVEYSDSHENSQPRNTRAMFHLVRIPAVIANRGCFE